MNAIVQFLLKIIRMPQVQGALIGLLGRIKWKSKRRRRREAAEALAREQAQVKLQPNIQHKTTPTMEFITNIFAQLFAKFEQKNPAVAALIALILLTVAYFADQGTALGVFALPSWAAEATKWLAQIALALNGAKTIAQLKDK
jgi:predicted histidine transporter YuiF (NhaC family)